MRTIADPSTHPNMLAALPGLVVFVSWAVGELAGWMWRGWEIRDETPSNAHQGSSRTLPLDTTSQARTEF